MVEAPELIQFLSYISYGLPEKSDVTISIFNANGQFVEELFRGTKPVGYHAVNWNAATHSSGTYFIKMVADDFVQIKKCLFLK